MTLGGNDLGFTSVLTTCALVASWDPAGRPCKKYSTAGGKNVLGERIDTVEGRVRDALTDIRWRSPDAEVIVVGHPAPCPFRGARDMIPLWIFLRFQAISHQMGALP
ncbi:hypothetical protein [Streptomyces sp. NRRL B-3648]|uniref:hypothetical protein n=1 Tax=Streptomyces sp. NRRL B-3648 TaxID=1519493 RepID=UPI0006AE3164|nr:hypothetical protein [Streptomyces sp. NRRL B-3648]